MKDIQNQKDYRNIAIDKVGIKGVKYPITVLDKDNEWQETVANVNMYVNLPHHFRGTHMSRFIEILNKHRGMMTMKNIHIILSEIREKLDSESAHLEIEFPYFIEKEAPVSKAKSLMGYNCKFIADQEFKKKKTGKHKSKKARKEKKTLNSKLKTRLLLSVQVPITTLCPCSKELSETGSAHNQRSIVTVTLKMNKFIWLEDIISIVESSASCEIYSLLKRKDEKFVTDKAYKNPKFVEDVVRDIAIKLNSNKRISWFKVESENIESIHNHNAYALVEKK